MQVEHGRLVVHISGGCCDGSSPMCLRLEDLPPGPHDARLGTIAGTDVVIAADQDERWGRPPFALDAAPGPGAGFSLDALEGLHLTLGR
jgi:uncharacterized protein (DUF779 family)